DAGQCDAGLVDRPVRHRDVHRDAGRREVADLALELQIGAGRARRRRYTDLGDQLIRLQRGHERAEEELVDRDRPLAVGAAYYEPGPQRQQRRAPVALWIGVRDRPGDCAEVAHDRIGDQRRSSSERAVLALQQIRVLAGLVADERADAQRAVLLRERV